jgi:hypothetical protein
MEEGRGSDGEKIDLKTGNKAKGNSNRTPSQIEAFERPHRTANSSRVCGSRTTRL